MSQCASCGKTFDCGMVDAGAASPCWCTTLPALPRELLGRDAKGCYCVDCLKRLLAATGDSLTGSAAW